MHGLHLELYITTNQLSSPSHLSLTPRKTTITSRLISRQRIIPNPQILKPIYPDLSRLSRNCAISIHRDAQKATRSRYSSIYIYTALQHSVKVPRRRLHPDDVVVGARLARVGRGEGRMRGYVRARTSPLDAGSCRRHRRRGAVVLNRESRLKVRGTC